MNKQNELNITGAIRFDGAFWRPIDADGFYMVSTDGRIWSVEQRQYLKPLAFCHERKQHYKYVKLLVDGKRKNLAIHRLVAIAFLNNPDGLPQVNHKDENPSNNDVSNLEWITPGDNIRYGTRTQRMSRTCKLKALNR